MDCLSECFLKGFGLEADEVGGGEVGVGLEGFWGVVDGNWWGEGWGGDGEGGEVFSSLHGFCKYKQG